MGNGAGDPKPGEAGAGVDRRAFLRRAAVAGTGAFVAPVIITVNPADAQALTSPPPEPPGSSSQPESPGVDLQPPGAGAPATGGSRPAGLRVSDRTELARTGADIDRLVAAGLAATAGGAALVLWSADVQSRYATPRSADPELEP
jgi:hypothetical protein